MLPNTLIKMNYPLLYLTLYYSELPPYCTRNCPLCYMTQITLKYPVLDMTPNYSELTSYSTKPYAILNLSFTLHDPKITPSSPLLNMTLNYCELPSYST